LLLFHFCHQLDNWNELILGYGVFTLGRITGGFLRTIDPISIPNSLLIKNLFEPVS